MERWGTTITVWVKQHDAWIKILSTLSKCPLCSGGSQNIVSSFLHFHRKSWQELSCGAEGQDWITFQFDDSFFSFSCNDTSDFLFWRRGTESRWAGCRADVKARGHRWWHHYSTVATFVWGSKPDDSIGQKPRLRTFCFPCWGLRFVYSFYNSLNANNEVHGMHVIHDTSAQHQPALSSVDNNNMDI